MQEPQEPKKSPLDEIVQPFIDLWHAPRALWGVNLAYLIEGMVYFGILTYLVMYFNENVGLNDIHAGYTVGFMTAGITLSMVLLGGLSDRWGIRTALLAAIFLMVLGRVALAGGPSLGLEGGRPFSSLHLLGLLGILLVVLGYGMYQPAAYSAVKQFMTPKTSAMGYAMLYALMNLGGWIPSFFGPLRNRIGIDGMLWFYAFFTAVALVSTYLILSKRTVANALATAKIKREDEMREAGASDAGATEKKEELKPSYGSVLDWIKNHPLADLKFSFFIFALIPAQTLFAHNWFTVPVYVARAYRNSWPWISTNFEAATNFNPLLIFILLPIVTALTQKKKVYNMMILGTFLMAAPAFLLAIGPTMWTLILFLVLMTIGEAMWQPRFLQYAAEIAPEGRTGVYMGVAQLPWFLTKMIVPMYSGRMLMKYCPDKFTVPTAWPGLPEITVYPPESMMHSQLMWLAYACIAMMSTVILLLAKGWIGKDFKTKAD
jgi:MFS family permease